MKLVPLPWKLAGMNPESCCLFVTITIKECLNINLVQFELGKVSRSSSQVTAKEIASSPSMDRCRRVGDKERSHVTNTARYPWNINRNRNTEQDLLTMRRARHKILQLFTFIPQQCFFLCTFYGRSSVSELPPHQHEGNFPAQIYIWKITSSSRSTPLHDMFRKLGNFVQPNFCYVAVHLHSTLIHIWLWPPFFRNG